ncbi:MAG: pyruvate, phosphate dikinase/phosphoenolpyruvate synthase regulator [Candidatus Zixiibacteriota bacterium]|nr:MAG: pyruvate, phosphate dikinase/phosphoenolpyruvate synthase regulator [candidate division Zixibacteria bacterium]
MCEPKKIVIVSDGTGKTAERLMDAVLAQYSQKEVEYSLVRTYQQVRDKQAVDRVLRDIDSDYLVIFSIISKDLSRYFHEQLTERWILHLSVLDPMISTMSKFLGVHPDYRPGLLQIIDDKYYRKVDAIGYTVEHDDGRGSMIDAADLVLVGLSRTCKTPIAMYLACNHGMKVANIPIVRNPSMEANLLERLKPVPGARIFGLMMQPEVLAHVREERLMFLARDAEQQVALREYYDLQEIREDLKFCRQLFNGQDWDTVDVTRRAIEEISLEILDKMVANRSGT